MFRILQEASGACKAMEELQVIVRAFEERGIEATLLERLCSKQQLKEISEDILTLFNALSYGAEKSVAVSFGAPSIYYNYFEGAAD